MARAEQVALLSSKTREREQATLQRLAREARAEAATRDACEQRGAGTPVAAIDGHVSPTALTLDFTFVDRNLFDTLAKYLTLSDLQNLLHRDTHAFDSRPDWSDVFQETEDTDAAKEQVYADAKACGESTTPRTVPGEPEHTHPVPEAAPETFGDAKHACFVPTQSKESPFTKFAHGAA